MADSRVDLETPQKPKRSFFRRLVLGTTTLSILSLVVMFFIVNTVVRGVIYDNVIGITQRDTIIYAREIDAWFKDSHQLVEYLTITWQTTGIEPGVGHAIDPIAASFMREFDFFMEVYVGFEDGRFVGGSGLVPDPDWDPTTRPWYKAAMEAPGEVVTVLPFVDDFTGNIIAAVSQWVPELDGRAAVVGVGIKLSAILETVERHQVAGGGYLILVGPNGEIISHPNVYYNPTPDRFHNLGDIPNGELLMEIIASSNRIAQFNDFRLGPSYFMVFPLEAADWILAAIVPATVVRGPVVQNLTLIMVTLAVFLIALFLFTMFFVSRITRSMEESHFAEERLRIVFDNMPLVSNVRSKDFGILTCNAEAPKMFGLRDKQEYLDRFFELSPELQPDGMRSDEKAESLISQAFATGKVRFEWMHQTVDEEPIPTDVTLVRVDIQGGDHILAFVRDLREAYAAQKKEHQLMQRMQAILDSSPLMCFIFDENCNVLEANQEAERLFKIPDKRIFMNNYFDFSPEYQPDGVASREKALAEVRKTLATGSTRYEWIYQLQDGTPIPSEEILEKVTLEGRDLVIAYTRDLRDLYKHIETNKRMQFLFDAMPLVLAFWDKNLNIMECNQEAVRRFGLSSKEEFKEKFFELSPEFQPDGTSSNERAIEFLQQGFSHGYIEFEWLHQKHDGTYIPTEVLCLRSEYMGQEILLTCARDLRELKESQQRETETNKRIQLMFNATPLIIEYWDKDFNCIDCNKTAIEFYGYSSTEGYGEKTFIDMPRFNLSAKASRDQWIQHLGKIFKEGYARFDWTEKRSNSEPVFLEVLGVRMNYNDDTVVVTYSNDVTQLKQTLIMMREADERAQLMLGGTPIACYLINKDFEAIDCNKETLHLFGFTDKADGIFNFKEVFAKHWFAEMKKYFDNALETGAERFEWVLQKPNGGGSIPCDITFIRLTHRGEYVIAAYIFDLRVLKEMLKERQRVEIAEEGSRAKSKFLARMSHEIRTPLTAVLGISEIQLKDPTLAPITEEAFAKIHNSASTLLGLVNDILDLSKIEAGKMTLMNGKYEVASMISDIVQLHLVYLGSKKIKFRIQVDEQLPTYLIGDELRIKQILGNLLSNAFKYTEEGSVELSLSRQMGDTAEGHVMLAIGVRDTGMGMTQKQVDALYDEYTRFHEREKRIVIGTGLGMSIVYSLVKMMDGQLEVESESSKGTSVVVRIPQEIASQEVLGKETAHNLQQLETSMGAAAKRFKFVPEPMPYGTVLVVDDVDTNLYVARGLLLFYDLKIETCDSGYDAIEKVRQGNVYDIIFMDHMMPGMDGLETTKILRGMGYTQPIVALTANALIGQAEELLRNGFDGFIPKPIQTTHLNSILTKFVRDKQPPEVIEAAQAAGGSRLSLLGREDEGIDGYLARPEVVDKLRADFARSQKNLLADIKRALNSGDLKTAHRLAHTLKGLASTIKETRLSRAAADLEGLLAKGEAGEVAIQQLPALERELAPVLAGIEAQTPNRNMPPHGVDLNKDRVREILDRLADSLAEDSAENLDLVEELRGIPEAAVLVRQVEEFDFDTASKTLATLKEVLEV